MPMMPPAITTQSLGDIATATRIESIENARLIASTRTTVAQNGDRPGMPFAIGERREFRMAWVDAIEMTVKPQPQAYTRLAERLYLFESLDGSGFKVELPVDEHGIVLDYPGLFRRVPADNG